MVESLIEFFGNMPKELVVFLISMLPIVELRGGLIAASLLGVEWYIAFPICVIGNMLPIPFILLFIRKIFDFLRDKPLFRRIIPKLEKKAGEKGSKINKGRFWGLFTFVAIPIPGTGAWMGALAATMFDIRLKKSLPIITLGVVTAGILMLIISYFIPGLFGF
ncbi:MAG: small multi-drug export protein [Clostridia bacterium]|nr:small multi-drug export protein [Clostridia bacterium]